MNYCNKPVLYSKCYSKQGSFMKSGLDKANILIRQFIKPNRHDRILAGRYGRNYYCCCG